MTTKRRRAASEPRRADDAPITGVATGNLGTAANLDETQVLRTTDLRAAAPTVFEDEADTAARAATPPHAPPAAPPPAEPPSAPPAAIAPLAPVKASPVSTRPGSRREPIDRRRGLALAGAGALATLLVLGGAGVLSQLDLGAVGAEPTAPGIVVTTPAATVTAQPNEADKGKGNCSGQGRGRHCRGDGDGGGGD